MTKRRKSKLLAELRNEFTTRPFSWSESKECEKIKLLPKKLVAYRNSFYGSGHSRTEHVTIPFNEFEVNYLIKLLEFIGEENELLIIGMHKDKFPEWCKDHNIVVTEVKENE